MSNYVNTWHHLVLTINATAWDLYLDGSHVSSTDFGMYSGGSIGTKTFPYSITYNMQGNYSNISFGTASAGTNNGPCYSDDFRIYNRVLSLAEVQSLYTYTSSTVVTTSYYPNLAPINNPSFTGIPTSITPQQVIIAL